MGLQTNTRLDEYRGLSKREQEVEFYRRELKVKRLEQLLLKLIALYGDSEVYKEIQEDFEDYYHKPCNVELVQVGKKGVYINI